MRAQIAITRTGVTQASSNHEPPDGGVLARPTNGDFRVTLHRKVSETALVQLLRSLRALAPDFEMSLETGDRPAKQLTRQQACHHIALRALGTLERANEAAFMSNLELFDAMLPPMSLQSEICFALPSSTLPTRTRRQPSCRRVPPTSKTSFRLVRTGRCAFISLPTRQIMHGPRRCRKPGCPSTKALMSLH